MAPRILITLSVVLLLGGGALAQTTQRGATDRADLLSGSPATADLADVEPDVLDSITLLLSGYEYFPSAGDLTAVTPDPVPYLLAIAYDSEGRWLPTHHHRAVAALAYFPTETTRAHLDYLLASPATPELMRHHVINALANGFGDEALLDLEPYLYDDDLQLRLTAVSAIGAIQTDRSVTVLQTALQADPDQLVEERIQRALTTRPVPAPVAQ